VNKKITIELSVATHLHAEKRAREKGFPSLEAYVDALIRDDAQVDIGDDWLRQRLEEGFASGNAGPLTDDVVGQLVAEGISRAKSRL
jgi:hypothetical protein